MKKNTAKHAITGTLAAIRNIELQTLDDTTANIRKENLKIESVEPKLIRNWENHDRNSFDLGDIEELAADIKNNGQHQPIIIRPIKNKSYKYEVIAGERRWRAATLNKQKVKAIILALDDKNAALTQISENTYRENLSDYSKGMNYFNLIEKKIISAKELQTKLNISKASVSNLLSYAHVPKIIWDAIKDPSKVSPKTASILRATANKGDQYVQAIVKNASALRNGAGEKTITKLIASELDIIRKNEKKINIKNSKGKILFSIKETARNKQIIFNSKVLNQIDFERLKVIIHEEIDKQMKIK